jgi:cob(I)alamin adenosyltransferase
VHIDARIQEANIDKGIIVLLTGNGKGKSSVNNTTKTR